MANIIIIIITIMCVSLTFFQKQKISKFQKKKKKLNFEKPKTPCFGRKVAATP